MMNNNHKNSGCGFAEELVSYLYGETSAAEKATFEKHLTGCSLCADEFEAFSGVQFSINDWKTKDFATLQNPQIEIPYPVTTNKQEVISVESSWLSGLRQLFSPKWSLAAASLAILAVFAGIVFFASKSPDGNDIAVSNKNTKIQVSPTAEKSREISNSNPKPNELPNQETRAPEKPQPELAVQNDPKNKRVVKATNSQRQPQKTETTNLPKTNEANRKNKKKDEIPPKIYEEEEEDDTLRLAEMFEEIDTVE